MIKRTYMVKQPNAKGDYKAAYDIASSLNKRCEVESVVDNIKVFRKYLYEVGAKLNRSYTTRKISDNCIYVLRIS